MVNKLCFACVISSIVKFFKFVENFKGRNLKGLLASWAFFFIALFLRHTSVDH